MPVLDLPDLHLTEARVYLFAVMIAPLRSPAEHWRLVEATRNTGVIRGLRKADASRIRPESLPLIVGAAAGPNLEIMSRTYPPDLFAAGYHRGHMAGRLLMFVLSCAEHEPASASLTHAYKIFGEAFVSARLKGGSRAYLAKAWSDYGPVSHLWVTQELWGRRPDGGKDFSEFLGHAESLRRLGEGHRPPKSPALLNPASTWKVPDRFVLPRWTGSLPHPDELIEAMTAWRRCLSRTCLKSFKTGHPTKRLNISGHP